MANLSVNPIDLTNVYNENKLTSYSNLESFKINHTYINKNHNQQDKNVTYDYSNRNNFIILHQNIRGITKKVDEFLISLPPNAPQVICLTEHHMQTEEIGNINFGQYSLGTAFCRQTFKQGEYVFLFLIKTALMLLT